MAEDHKHFLELLIRGYAGDPSEPRHPLESGRDEADWRLLNVQVGPSRGSPKG